MKLFREIIYLGSLIWLSIWFFNQFIFLYSIDALIFFSITQLIEDFLKIFLIWTLFSGIYSYFFMLNKLSSSNFLIMTLVWWFIWYISTLFIALNFIFFYFYLFYFYFFDWINFKIIYKYRKKSAVFIYIIGSLLFLVGLYLLYVYVNDMYNFQFINNWKEFELFYLNDNYVFSKTDDWVAIFHLSEIESFKR
jgi:hypothetical protein